MFDAPSIEECYRRDETIVPQQALALTNSGVALARAAEIAAAIDKEVGESDTPRPSLRGSRPSSGCWAELRRTCEQAECAGGLDRLRSVFAAENQAGPVPHRKARAALVHVLVNHNDFVSIR